MALNRRRPTAARAWVVAGGLVLVGAVLSAVLAGGGHGGQGRSATGGAMTGDADRPPAEAAAAARAPDVIMITVDTLRADFVAAYGARSIATPHMDNLLRSGTRFEAAYATVPRTSPALGSLMTGLWPSGHGSLAVGQPVANGRTLAEILAARGYRTVGVSANSAAAEPVGLDRGFQEFVGPQPIKARIGPLEYRPRTRNRPHGTGLAGATTDVALSLVRHAAADKPLFLWVHYMDPHTPYAPPEPWHSRTPAPACWDLYARLVEKDPDQVWRAFTNHGGIAEAAVDDCMALYAGEVEFVDQQLGRLLRGLARERSGAPRVTVLASDHGEAFGEGGMYFEHGELPHDASLRLVLGMVLPGAPGGRVFRSPVSVTDVLPTVLAHLGKGDGTPEHLDGRNLIGCLGLAGPCERGPERGLVFAESGVVLRNQHRFTIQSGLPGRRACMHGPRFTFCDRQEGESQARPRLFDHRVDPALTRDVSAAHPDALAQLRSAAAHWPPGTARIRVALGERYRLVQTPELDGGYTTALYAREQDPAQETDLSEQDPAARDRLSRALEAWAAQHGVATAGEKLPGKETVEMLRALGYVQ